MLRGRHNTNTEFFVDVRPYVHDYALQILVQEKQKLPVDLRTMPADVMDCTCTLRASMGLPCQHEIRVLMANPGAIRLSNIDPHWYYVRGATDSQLSRRILLNPAVVKGKGRPKGARGGHGKNQGSSTTRRDPSLFEHAAIELPSSSALETVTPARNPQPPRRKTPELPSHPAVIPQVNVIRQGARWDIRGNNDSHLSTTQLGITRGGGTEEDLYDPGTARERAYLRSIAPQNLVRVVDVERLTMEAQKDHDNQQALGDGVVCCDANATSTSEGLASGGTNYDLDSEVVYAWLV